MSLEERIEGLTRLEELFGEYVTPVLAEQVQDRVSGIIRTPTTPENQFSMEFQKGFVVGLESVVGTVSTLLEQAKYELDQLVKESEHE